MVQLQQLTIPQVLFNLSGWLLMLLMSRHQFARQSNRGVGYTGFLFFVILFSTFGFTSGDYFHYQGLYDQISQTHVNQHLEDIYFWLIVNLPDSYTIWRFVVWSGAAIFFALTLRRMKADIQFAGLIFCLILLCYFPNMRQSLGYSVLYFSAATIFFSKGSKTKAFILGMIGIVCSYFLHKSMFVYILLFGMALIPFNKWIYLLSIPLFPILYKSVTLIAMYFLTNTIADETSIESGTEYIESDFYQIANIFGLLQLSLWRIPILLLLFYAIRNIYFKKEPIKRGYKVFLNYTFILIYISFLFYGQQTSAFLSPRFWDASTYTATIFLSCYLYDKPRTKLIKGSLYCLILANLYNFSYAIYLISFK